MSLHVADSDLTGARIVWEARGEEPSFGGLIYTFSPGPNYGDYWIEAEVQWPDGRRAFATNSVTINIEAPPQVSNPRVLPNGDFAFHLAGTPQVTYITEASSDLSDWLPISTNTLPGTGVMEISDPQTSAHSGRCYRVLKVP